MLDWSKTKDKIRKAMGWSKEKRPFKKANIGNKAIIRKLNRELEEIERKMEIAIEAESDKNEKEIAYAHFMAQQLSVYEEIEIINPS